VGSGFFWAALPSGKSEVVSVVSNPGRERGRLAVEVNGASGGAEADLAPGQTATLRTKISGDPRDVCVRYRGDREIVVLQTDFQ
jgi:hypothetical protein